MTAQKSVDVGNTHLTTIIDYTKSMVAANRVQPENAPAFMNALSEAMMETLNKFESVIEVTARAANDVADASRCTVVENSNKQSNKTKTSSKMKEAKMPNYSKTAKMREALTREGQVPTDLPAIAAAHRFVAPKRSVGRPRKDAPKPVITAQQRAFDRAFLAKYPILPGLSAQNSVSDETITILMDGKKLKMIGRHLEAAYGINTDDYKRIYSLGEDYPTCAPGYRSVRRGHAKKQGLGTEKVPKTPKAFSEVQEVTSLETPKTVADVFARQDTVAA
jgi:predicted transcriptional regulator